MTESKPRKPWVAGLLSLIQPGLGQLYNGEIRKALVAYLLPVLTIPAMVVWMNSGHPTAILAGYIVAAVVYYAFFVSDAAMTAKRLGADFVPKFNKAVIIGIYIFIVVFNHAMSAAIKQNIVQAYKLPAGSMEPTLQVGDHILVDRTASAKKPHRGSLIVFEYPADPAKDFIKRIVAVGGDTVEIRDKVLSVNGKAAQEPYAVHTDADMIPADQNPRDNFGPAVVPAGAYFVLGDNRDRSYDSRFWGFVPEDKVKGTVERIYWSWDKKASAVRWDRIGMKVR